MKFNNFQVATNNYLRKIFRTILAHALTFLATVFSVPLGRKLFFGLIAIVFFFVLISLVEPYTSLFYRKISWNPDMTVYNKCIFGVIEKAPIDEEFSWRLSACGEAPSRFKWPF